MKKGKILVGAHISIAGGIHKSVERATKIGCTTMQIFTKNNKSWFAKPIPKEEVELFIQAMKKNSLSKIMVHTSYLINIASAKSEVEKKSVKALKLELQRCEQLKIPYLVFHPGAHLGAGEEEGIKKIAKNLDAVLAHASGKTKILIENMAGQGTSIGHDFKQIKKIRQLCKHKNLVGVCIDTCHLFVAGYDIKTEDGYKKTFDQISKIIGLRNVKAIHLNDSKTGLGSKKDRHQNLGKGLIPRKTFKMIMNDKRLQNIPKILETPDASLYEKEIAMLKKMVQ